MKFLPFVLFLTVQALDASPGRGHVQLEEPVQGFVSSDGALQIRWAMAGVPAGRSALKVVLMVNGLIVQVTEAGSAENRMVLKELQDGPYRVHVFLSEYDEFEGLSNVQSSSLVECWVDQSGALGGVPPANPQAFMVKGFTPYKPARRPGAQEGRGPVIVFTYHCNRPDFVELQAAALKHFLLDDYKLIVIK